MGKTSLEEAVVKEAEMLIQYFSDHLVGKPTYIDWTLNIAVLNVIWQMCAGKHETEDLYTEYLTYIDWSSYIVDIDGN